MATLSSRRIDELEERYGHLWWSANMYPKDALSDPFKHLILTILSQNTSEANCIRAYKGLAARFEITPAVLVEARSADIKKAIRSGGLYNIKADRIKGVSKVVLESHRGDVNDILSRPKAEAKRLLIGLPGIGNKTADVLLTDRYSYKEVIPIDTHMERIAKRLGLVGQAADYGAVQKALMDFTPAKRRERAAGLIWLLAKHTCRAQNPRCHECLLDRLCAHAQERKSAKRPGHKAG